MLRTAVLMFACLAIALGVYLCTHGLAGRGGIQTLTGGTFILLGTLFERWRYRNRNVTASRGEWQPTGERFVDPGSGEKMEVFYDPKSGERLYRKESD